MTLQLLSKPPEPTEWAAIREILQGFDFISVHRLMELLGWKWANQTPTVEVLRRAAQRLLQEFFEDPDALSLECGGLRVERITVEPGRSEIKLTFEAICFSSEFVTV